MVNVADWELHKTVKQVQALRAMLVKKLQEEKASAAERDEADEEILALVSDLRELRDALTKTLTEQDAPKKESKDANSKRVWDPG